MTKLNLLVIRAKELENAVAFYSALGLEFVLEQHGKGPEHYAAVMDDLVLEIYPSRDAAGVELTRLGFRVESVATMLDRLIALGARTVSEPKKSQWGLRAVVADPDGRKIELVERGDD